ncbi:MAG: Spy/CpxP family protein refolding chaperone [Candidatus Omnitrophota bacterium]
MKKQIFKKIMVLAVAASLVLSACPAFSQPEEKCEERGKKEKFIEELGLTDEQKEEMKSLRKANKEKKNEFRQALRDKRKELRKELGLYDSDMQKVQGIVSEVKDLQGKLIDFRVKSIMDTKEILTEEQFGKFSEKTKKAFKKRHGKMKKRRRER